MSSRRWVWRKKRVWKIIYAIKIFSINGCCSWMFTYCLLSPALFLRALRFRRLFYHKNNIIKFNLIFRTCFFFVPWLPCVLLSVINIRYLNTNYSHICIWVAARKEKKRVDIWVHFLVFSIPLFKKRFRLLFIHLNLFLCWLYFNF